MEQQASSNSDSRLCYDIEHQFDYDLKALHCVLLVDRSFRNVMWAVSSEVRGETLLY